MCFLFQVYNKIIWTCSCPHKLFLHVISHCALCNTLNETWLPLAVKSCRKCIKKKGEIEESNKKLKAPPCVRKGWRWGLQLQQHPLGSEHWASCIDRWHGLLQSFALSTVQWYTRRPSKLFLVPTTNYRKFLCAQQQTHPLISSM